MLGSVLLLPPAQRGEAPDAYRARVAPLLVGRTVIGVEIPGGDPALPLLAGNLDPQHGGGVFGLPLPEGAGGCAAQFASHIARALEVAPANALCVFRRPDLDSFVAAAILLGRVSPEELCAEDVEERLARLGAVDEPMGIPGTWRPFDVSAAVQVGEHREFGPINSLCLSAGRPGAPTADEVLGVVAEWLLTGAAPPSAVERWEADRAELVAYAADVRVTPCGRVAHIADLPLQGGSLLCYERAPVALMTSESFPLPGGERGRKHTLCVHPNADAGLHAAWPRVEAALAAAEQGWGGNPATRILGSPMGRPSVLPHEQVLEVVLDALGPVSCL